jgi:chitinase
LWAILAVAATGCASAGESHPDVEGGTESGTAPRNDGAVETSAVAVETGAVAVEAEAGAVETGAGASDAAGAQEKLFVGYYQTWSDAWKATGAETALAHLPPYVNVVDIAFMQPDTTYARGSLALGGTGVGVPYDGPTLKDAVTALHARAPGTKVMISVGGATFTNWSGFRPAAIADFVADFGLDGADVDYEPANPNCGNAGGRVACPSSDVEYVSVVTAMRAALPAGQWLSIAAFSVGAYGEGRFADALPTGSAYMGMSLALFKDARASAALDLVNVMSYDAGPTYDPAQALAAYQTYFPGRIAMGIEVPPEAWGGHIESLDEIAGLAATVQANRGAGLMLWSLQKSSQVQSFATAICTGLGLGTCATPLF